MSKHLVRPDRVYATGVLTPIVGYQPAQDAQQVAARFVGGGQLAGPRAEVQLLGRRPGIQLFGRALRGPILDSVWLRVQNWFAGLKVRLQVHRIQADLKTLPAPAVFSIDTSPRPSEPYAGAIGTESGWAPAPQSPETAVAAITNNAAMKEEPGTLNALQASQQIGPQGINFAQDVWSRSISPLLPRTLAVRAENTALFKFFANRRPGAGY